MKYLLILLTALLFVGCDNSYNDCKTYGYDGFVIEADVQSPSIYCSNGELVQNGDAYLTKDGIHYIQFDYVYIPFQNEKEEKQ